MRTRLDGWYDSKRDKIFHGISVFVHGSWARVFSKGKPLLFDNERDAQAKRKELRKRPQP